MNLLKFITIFLKFYWWENAPFTYGSLAEENT